MEETRRTQEKKKELRSESSSVWSCPAISKYSLSASVSSDFTFFLAGAQCDNEDRMNRTQKEGGERLTS